MNCFILLHASVLADGAGQVLGSDFNLAVVEPGSQLPWHTAVMPKEESIPGSLELEICRC